MSQIKPGMNVKVKSSIKSAEAHWYPATMWHLTGNTYPVVDVHQLDEEFLLITDGEKQYGLLSKDVELVKEKETVSIINKILIATANGIRKLIHSRADKLVAEAQKKADAAKEAHFGIVGQVQAAKDKIRKQREAEINAARARANKAFAKAERPLAKKGKALQGVDVAQNQADELRSAL